MDAIVEDKGILFQDVFAHLEAVRADTGTKLLDEELLRRAQRALDFHTPQDLLWRILRTGESLLQALQQDPRPLTQLLEQTVLLIPFDDLRSSISAEKLIEGLTSPSTPVQLLCLAYLKKASDIPSGASFVACSPALVQTLVTVWLSSESTETAERTLEVIIALLAVDSPQTVTFIGSSNSSGGEVEGQGLFWKRLFQDPDVHVLLFAWTSLKHSNHDLTSKQGSQAVTISQARLFDFIARVASLNWAAVTTSTQSQIEREYSAALNSNEQPFGGLLQYAANGMIDSNDYLMDVLRQDLFTRLVTVIEEEHPRGVSPRAMKAIQNGAGVDSPEADGANGMHL